MSATGLRRLVATETGFDGAWREVSDRGVDASSDTESIVSEIIATVRADGDAALQRYTERFDQRSPSAPGYEIPLSRCAEAFDALPESVAKALTLSADRVRRFHAEQRVSGYELDGGKLALRAQALERVGVYVPGGTARYPSSVLMTAIPAQVAGVEEIIMVSPGASQETLAAAHVAGVSRVFEIGGAQAVAALAYGTESVPRVDKIVGPGNQWVAAAKRQVYGQVDIDSVAGPSEVLIVADDAAEPAVLAADLLAQAEHDTQARAILISTSSTLLDRVDAALTAQLQTLPRKEIASAAIERYGVGVLVPSLDLAVQLSNDYAPEHLELAFEGAADRVDAFRTAGAIFVGHHSPEAAGDYAAGHNHVLPTGGAARFSSPLGVYDFVKYTTVMALGADDLAELRDAIETLAEVEGLHAHGRSISIRYEDRDE